MDRILIEGLTLPALIGVYQWERQGKTSLLADIELITDLRRPAQSDNVADTIDYAEVAEQLVKLAADSQYELLEALAAAMIDHLLANYPLQQVKVKLTKPNILPNAQNVAVELCRQAQACTM